MPSKKAKEMPKKGKNISTSGKKRKMRSKSVRNVKSKRGKRTRSKDEEDISDISDAFMSNDDSDDEYVASSGDEEDELEVEAIPTDSEDEIELDEDNIEVQLEEETNKKKKMKIDDEKNQKKKKKSDKKISKSRIVDPTSLCDEWNIADILDEVQYTPKEADPPESLNDNIRLLPFQRESLTWMVQQERDSKWRGGILADDMGMGKTLQAITLMLTHRMDENCNNEDNLVKSTLVMCPVVALQQWKDEIRKYTKENSLTAIVYHGSDRAKDIDILTKYDVVITSYSVLESDYRYQEKGFKRKGEVVKKKSILHSVKWFRVIIDEAHFIKSRNCSTAYAVYALDAKYRWSLTGTPLQNRIGELFSLVRFMQLTPFSYYYCYKCPCKMSSWKFKVGEGCISCGHSPMSHFSWWNKFILNPIKKYGVSDEKGQESMRILKCVLQRIMLRRTKLDKADDLCLPPRNIYIRNDYLNAEENDFYESLYSQSKTKFMGYVEEGTILNNYAHVFDLLLRLRQAVDHPLLVLYAKDKAGGKEVHDWCSICFEPAEGPVRSKCKHTFCRGCIENYLGNSEGEKKVCPECKRQLTINLSDSNDGGKENSTKYTSIMQSVDPANWRSSTKIEALMEELTRTKEKYPNRKSLVFSQFVNFLDLIEWRLILGGFKCVKLDGRMNAIQKDLAIHKFNNDPDVTVFLISLKAGGIALNLTVASHCYLLDPWWNPAAEFQAIDRIYRLGQYKCISVVRFIIPNSIEERILQLQEKKHLLFNSTVGMDQDALAHLTVEDLHFLFH